MAENSVKYAVFGVGNALLDVSSEVPAEIFEQYGLIGGNAILAEDKHAPLFEYLHGLPTVEYISGGATLNSIRVANWMLKASSSPRPCSYTSILGNDDTGKKFVEGLVAEGVDTAFARSSEESTGQCAVCIKEKERSLVAALNACNKFPTGDEDYLKTEESSALWQNSQVCYIAGFWLTVNVEGMQNLGKFYAQDDAKLFCMNISAPFLASFFLPQMKSVLEYVDILFGNETEAEALAKAMNLDANAEGKYDIATVAAKFTELSKRPGARVIITQGKDPCIIATKGGETKSYDTPPLESNLIVDTNGAGDSFVGGFLAALTSGLPEEKCVAWGNYAAQFIIQTSGCQFGGKSATPPS